MRGTKAKALRKEGKRKPGRKHAGNFGILISKFKSSRKERRKK